MLGHLRRFWRSWVPHPVYSAADGLSSVEAWNTLRSIWNACRRQGWILFLLFSSFLKMLIGVLQIRWGRLGVLEPLRKICFSCHARVWGRLLDKGTGLVKVEEESSAKFSPLVLWCRCLESLHVVATREECKMMLLLRTSSPPTPEAENHIPTVKRSTQRLKTK